MLLVSHSVNKLLFITSQAAETLMPHIENVLYPTQETRTFKRPQKRTKGRTALIYLMLRSHAEWENPRAHAATQQNPPHWCCLLHPVTVVGLRLVTKRNKTLTNNFSRYLLKRNYTGWISLMLTWLEILTVLHTRWIRALNYFSFPTVNEMEWCH